MKKVILFIGIFLVTYFGLEIASGTILTALYTPNVENAWKGVSSIPSHVELVGTNFPLMTLIFLLIAMGISLGITKLVSK